MYEAPFNVLVQAMPAVAGILAGAVASVAAVRSFCLGIIVCAVLRTRDIGRQQLYYRMFRDLLGQPVIRRQR
jgi:hypothetical protein